MRNFSNLANVVTFRTYSRDRDGKLESWEQIVERVIRGNTRIIDVPTSEKERLHYYLSNRKAGPAGRGWWFSGAEAQERLGGAALNNCWYLSCEDWRVFVVAQDLLMLGGGVGMSIEKMFTSKLPKVKQNVKIIHRATKDADFIVPDTREGWCELTSRTLESLFSTGKSFSYSTVCIRGKDEPIKGFGGRASGPLPLINCIDKITKIVKGREGKFLKPVDAMDILCCIGEMVVAGNVRRCLPKGSKVFCKNGLVSIEDVAIGDNVLTSDGYRKVTSVFEQGEQELLEIKTKEGSFRCTPNHRMAVKDGAGFKWKEARDIDNTDALLAPTQPIDGIKTALPSWTYDYPKHSTTCVDITIPQLDIDIAWLIGLIHSDGYVYANRKDDGFNAYISIVLGIDELHIAERAQRILARFGTTVTLRKRKNENAYIVHTQSKQLAYYMDEHIKKPKIELEIPDFISSGELDIRLAYLAGVLDGDGSAKNRPPIAATTCYKDYALALQQLYYTCGLSASYSAQGTVPSRPHHWKELHKVSLHGDRTRGVIQEFSEKKINRLKRINNNTHTKDEIAPGKNYRFVDVIGTQLGGSAPTFDIEVEDAHNFYCEGYLTHNSSLIILGDSNDKDYLKSKRWDLGPVPNHRAMANLSVVGDDVDDFHPLFWETYKNGEPFGIVNRKNIRKYGRMGELKADTAQGVNPSLRAGTKILTTEGILPIESLEGKKFTVINLNGQEAEAECWLSGKSKKLWEVELSSGIKYYATAEHKWPVVSSLGVTGAINKKTTDSLTSGDILHVNRRDSLPIIPNANSFDSSNTCERLLSGSEFFRRQYIQTLYNNCGELNNKYGILLHFRDKNVASTISEILGFYGIINSVISNEISTESVSIKGEDDIKHFINVFINASNEDPAPSYTTNAVVNIKETDLYEDVWDIRVDSLDHCFTLSHCITGNCAEATLESYVDPIHGPGAEPCNLQEIALPNIENVNEFVDIARLMHRWGKRVTMEPCHIPTTQEIINRNRRIGSGITGCLRSPLFTPDILNIVYEEIQKENVEYSQELGISESIRTTVIKPSGTISKVFDMGGYEGIHPAYSRFFIQRVRFSSSDPLIPILAKAGHYIEPVVNFDGSLNAETVVVDFYEQAPSGYPVADEDWTTWKQLDTLLMAQRHWSDQAVSVTVYYKREELEDLKEWLRKNLCKIKTISFLCHNDHGFKQAPKQAISETDYINLSKNITPIDTTELTSTEDSISGTECEGGACPIR